MKKNNNLYVIFGGRCNEDDDYNVYYKDYTPYTVFKNKEKAYQYIEKLIDDFMKMKSYSLNYEIIEAYKVEDAPIETYFTDIRDKNDYTVFRIEMTIIDLNKVIM